jgi:hypothetical protein
MEGNWNYAPRTPIFAGILCEVASKCTRKMHYVYRRFKQSQCNALSFEPVHRHHSRVAPCSILPNLRNRRPFSNPTHHVMTRLSKSADSVDKDQWIR